MTVRFGRRAAVLLAALALGATVTACDDGGTGDDTGAAAAPLVYTALGDSFASGEGAPPYEAASGSCKRTAAAWPRKLDADSTRIASVDHRACSGAKTANLTAAWSGRGLPAQIPATPDPSVTLVTVVIGGNDAGFGDIVGACIIWACPSPTEKGFTSRLATLGTTLKTSVYPALEAAYPNARIAHVGYPKITPPPGKAVRSCTWLSRSDQSAADGIVTKINSTIKAAAAAKGVTYVDVSKALAGHELCTTSSWVRSVLTDGQAHPTADGQKAIEKAVATALSISLS